MGSTLNIAGQGTPYIEVSPHTQHCGTSPTTTQQLLQADLNRCILSELMQVILDTGTA